MDWNPIVDGLRVSGIGMGMVAIVLIILAIFIRVASWADATVQKRSADTTSVSIDEFQPVPYEHTARSADTTSVSIDELESVEDGESTDSSDKDGATRAAAIGVALALAESENMSSLTQGASRIQSTVAASSAGAWLEDGRARQRGGNRNARRSVWS